MNKAVFLDRDGVINVDRGYTYRIEDFEFIDGVFEACKLFAALGYRLIVVTNQSGIGRGLYSEQDFLINCRSLLSNMMQNRHLRPTKA